MKSHIDYVLQKLQENESKIRRKCVFDENNVYFCLKQLKVQKY